MDLGNIDKLEQSKELVNGLTDIIVSIESVHKDDVLPVTVLCPFKVILDKVYSLLAEIEEKEKEGPDYGGRKKEPV